MADDDRYRWLDEEAAERLLRGSSLNARSTLRAGRPDEHHYNVGSAPAPSGSSGGTTPSWARPGVSGQAQHLAPAERLAAALDALVAEQTATAQALGAARSGRAPSASMEFPGEAAALDAFRAARSGLLHSGTVDITAGPTEAGTVVGRRAAFREGRGRSGDRRPGAARRTSLAGRPLRAGFAMAVAGCALGGAAVAAGAGVLPTPFGGGGAPAASVSPLASPSGEREATRGGGSTDESGGPRRGTREGGGSSPTDSPSGDDLAGTERGRDGKPKDKDKGWGHDGKGLSESGKRAIARALCVAYEEHDLPLHDRWKLEQVAGGPEGVEKFCDEHGGGNNAQSGGVGTPGGPGGDGGPGGRRGPRRRSFRRRRRRRLRHGNGNGGGIGTPGGGADGGDGTDGGDGSDGGRAATAARVNSTAPPRSRATRARPRRMTATPRTAPRARRRPPRVCDVRHTI